ncbi:MAG TPA: biosynthetic arginine decarboxylase [Gammaproteobacteria bacterium]|nr:biosynthetic arginine decarboxylase [Gammaproteobacteria bacterium]
MKHWGIEDARHLYRLPGWSEGYFDVGAGGRLQARIPYAAGVAEVDLYRLSQELRATGLRLPVLVRCVDLLHHRVKRLCEAFDRAMQAAAYQGGYRPVYPIKVNQQFSVVREILAADPARVGLEAGSKPELMAVLGLVPPGGRIVCNGYKDREYIRLALIGRRLGLDLYLVLEKLSELPCVLEEAASLGVDPMLGVRVRMSSIGAGNWQNTGGARAKFGLRSAQVLELVRQLRAAGRLDCLRMLHFHLGSQLANLDDIRKGVAEAAQLYADLRALGAPVEILDVGGGLGVDYEGTASRSFCSMNYGLADYARVVVEGIGGVCAERGLPQPQLLSESGRALTAHHAFLVTNVIDIERAPENQAPGPAADPEPVRTLADIWQQAETHAPLETWHASGRALDALYAAYNTGQLDLAARARGEQFHYATLYRLRTRLSRAEPSSRKVLDQINQLLADKYFCNLSVFQSMPDVWGLGQIFPIVPLQRLDEPPTRRTTLEDLTCDSDGRIDYYVDGGGVEQSMPVHDIAPGEDYLLGIFLLGAYQEILGDMHNLFGDTDAVDIEITADGGHRLRHAEQGDRSDELLRYVHFDPDQLRAAYRQRVVAAGLDPAEAHQVLDALEAGLTGYTYLE